MFALVDLGIVSQNLLGRSHHLDAIKNIHDSCKGKGQNTHSDRSEEEVDLEPHG